MNIDSQTQIDQLIAAFFALVDNRNGLTPDLNKLYDMFVDGAVITKVNGNEIEVMTLEQFIGPRQPLLTNGTLTEFYELETTAQTHINEGGAIATRICQFEKMGKYEGKPYSGGGDKHIQLVKTANGWRISAIVWQDFSQ